MSGPESTQVAAEWVGKAENDIINARNTIKMGENCPTDTVCFHASQCVEKYLKALLAARGTPFPKSHEIEVLLALLPEELHPKISAREQELLTDYATAVRYPGSRRIDLREAEAALALAESVRTRIRALLPREALTNV